MANRLGDMLWRAFGGAESDRWVRVRESELRTLIARVDALEEENRPLRGEIDELRAENRVLKAENQELRAENERLRKENAELRGRLGQDSTNSSRPPSSDPPSVKRPGKSRSGRRPGKQKGSKGHRRHRMEPTQVVDRRPSACGKCGGELDGTLTSVGYEYRQQIETPPVRPMVTEYRYHKLVCPDCGEVSRAPVLEEDRPCCGPRLTAQMAVLTTEYNLSRRLVEGILDTFLGTKVSLGTVDNRIHEVGQALEDPVEELKDALGQEALLNIDETGWKKNGERRWLWTFVASTFAVFHIAASRGKDVLIELLGDLFGGIIVSDRWKSYISYHDGSRWQICLAHLIRNAKQISQAEDPQAARLGHWIRRELKLLIHLRKRSRADPLPMNACKARLKRACIRAEKTEHRDARNLGKAIVKHWESVVLFTKLPGVPPTNNIAERTLRRSVQARKLSFGNHSDRGLVTTARLRTVLATCRMRDVHPIDYLTDVVTRYRRGETVPSILNYA